MPCRSDYLEQTGEEARNQITAKLVLWLTVPGRSGKLLMKTQQRQFEKQAENYYAEDKGQVRTLCNFVKALRATKTQHEDQNALDAIFQENYNDPMSRRLADWVEEHDEADRRRVASEARSVRNGKLDKVSAAIAQLTDDKLDQILKILQN